MAKENESHGGRDGEKKSGGFHKEGLRPSFPHTAVYIQQESLGLGGGVSSECGDIALRPPHAPAGLRGSVIVTGTKDGTEQKVNSEGALPARPSASPQLLVLTNNQRSDLETYVQADSCVDITTLRAASLHLPDTRKRGHSNM